MRGANYSPRIHAEEPYSFLGRKKDPSSLCKVTNLEGGRSIGDGERGTGAVNLTNHAGQRGKTLQKNNCGRNSTKEAGFPKIVGAISRQGREALVQGNWMGRVLLGKKRA